MSKPDGNPQQKPSESASLESLERAHQDVLRNEQAQELQQIKDRNGFVWVKRSKKNPDNPHEPDVWSKGSIITVDKETRTASVDVGTGYKNLDIARIINEHRTHSQELANNEKAKVTDISHHFGKDVRIRRSSGKIEEIHVEGMLGNKLAISRISPDSGKVESRLVSPNILRERVVADTAPKQQKPERTSELRVDQKDEIRQKEKKITDLGNAVAEFEKISRESNVFSRNNPFGAYKKLRRKLEEAISTPTGEKSPDSSGWSDSMKDDLGGMVMEYFTPKDLAIARNLTDSELTERSRIKSLDR